MHVDRFAAVETVEEEPVRSWNSGDPWHVALPALMFAAAGPAGKRDSGPKRSDANSQPRSSSFREF